MHADPQATGLDLVENTRVGRAGGQLGIEPPPLAHVDAVVHEAGLAAIGLVADVGVEAKLQARVQAARRVVGAEFARRLVGDTRALSTDRHADDHAVRLNRCG